MLSVAIDVPTRLACGCEDRLTADPVSLGYLQPLQNVVVPVCPTIYSEGTHCAIYRDI